MSGGQHRNDEVNGRAGRVNVKRKEVEIARAIINQAQLRRPRGVRRRSKKTKTNVVDGADFVRDVRNIYPKAQGNRARSICSFIQIEALWCVDANA
jgi:hypothetical protein